ncbi:uncharacterized protein LOC123655756 [Melitaea cinxia]|uniref:uncharacterized protein LOC123655756 n=1 Tax=Melitaea cinxia TaxID=113334 RepID=UPI001E26FE34|nr:uncharacterized protein LOC123655756 [Melitaea cinxia]
MASNTFLANVPKLLGRENYSEWAFAAENLLVLEGMSNCIKQDSAKATAEDAKAKAKLILTISPSLYVHIKEASSTYDLWQKLRSMFDDSGFSRRISLLRNLISIRLDSCESMTIYITQIIETAQKLSGTGFIVNDEWIGCLLLAGLPEKYLPMIMAIEHSGIAITADVVKSKLIDLAGNDTEGGSAFLSKRQKNCQHSSHRNDSTFHHGGTNVKTEKMNIKCYRCKQFGHFKSQCHKNNPNRLETKKTNAFSAVFLNGLYSKHDFYLDSGASVHMTADVSLMTKNACYTPRIKEIMAADKNKMSVLCSGDVNIITVTPNCKYEVTLKDVLCVPNLTTNLISVSQLIKNGNKVEFKKNCCNVYNQKNELVAVANQINGVYKLSYEKPQCLFTYVNSEIWHRRMGHLNINDLNKMKNGAVTGISFKDCASSKNKSNCKVCCEGKQSRLPFDNVGTRSNEPLSIIHADAGIVHQKTNPYTPEQNGLSERTNRTIVEKARCLLFDAGLDKKFWAEATNTAVYLKNRSVASGLDNKTPYELWTNKKPDLSHVRMFGSEVMVHVPKEKRLKWDTKSKKHILVGFSENVKGYRIYDPTKRSVTTSRDVIIHENLENCLDNVSATVSVGENKSEESDSINIKGEGEIKVEPSSDELNLSSDLEYNEALTDLDCKLQRQEADDERKSIPKSPVITKRIKKQPERYGYSSLCTTHNPEVISDPTSVQEAMQSQDRDKWVEAMKDELQAFEENDAWSRVSEVPSDKTIVQCKWVYKKKVNSDNSVRYRARLVAKGFSQRPGIDYEETFSPVVGYSTLRLLFALSVQLNLDIIHLDVKTAFLNGYLKEDIYMYQPVINCDDNKEKVIVKLNKAIYGLKQSSRSWYERVEQCLCELNFKKSHLEPCVFTKIDKDVKQCLGMRVKVNKESNMSITLDQQQYIEHLLIKFNMIDCKDASTPMDSIPSNQHYALRTDAAAPTTVFSITLMLALRKGFAICQDLFWSRLTIMESESDPGDRTWSEGRS